MPRGCASREMCSGDTGEPLHEPEPGQEAGAAGVKSLESEKEEGAQPLWGRGQTKGDCWRSDQSSQESSLCGKRSLLSQGRDGETIIVWRNFKRP